jgi:hypothetical protein
MQFCMLSFLAVLDLQTLTCTALYLVCCWLCQWNLVCHVNMHSTVLVSVEIFLFLGDFYNFLVFGHEQYFWLSFGHFRFTHFLFLLHVR